MVVCPHRLLCATPLVCLVLMMVVAMMQNPSRIHSLLESETSMLLHSKCVSRAFMMWSQAVVTSDARTNSLSACVVPPTHQEIGYAVLFQKSKAPPLLTDCHAQQRDQCPGSVSPMSKHCFTSVYKHFHRCPSSASPMSKHCFTDVQALLHQCPSTVLLTSKLCFISVQALFHQTRDIKTTA